GSFTSDTFSAGNTNLTRQSSTGSDAFLIRTDVNGNTTLVRQGSNAKVTAAAFISGSVYLAGQSEGETSFDGVTPTNPTTGMFVTRYNSNTGSIVWCRGDMLVGNRMILNWSQQLITAGTFTGTVEFQSTTLTTDAPASPFIAKYDHNGNVLWAHVVPGLGADTITSIYLDGQTNSWIAGTVAAPGADESERRLFVACYDYNGNLRGWSKAEGSGSSGGGALAHLNTTGTCAFLTGHFTGEFKLGGYAVTNHADNNIFLARLMPPPPRITSHVTNNAFVVLWPYHSLHGFESSERFILQSSPDLVNWSNTGQNPTQVSSHYAITNAIGTTNRFFRLRLWWGPPPQN
ncbi:MAG: hypothetical protein ACK4UN_11535, partial [Limisphaerales bacterium]